MQLPGSRFFRSPLLRVLLAACAALLGAGGLSAAQAHPGPDVDLHTFALGNSIALVSDCGPGDSPPNCGYPPAIWAAAKRPVQVCSIDAGRPAWLSAAGFRQQVATAADSWNRAEIPLGIRYVGECPPGSTLLAGDGRNELGFEPGAVVSGGEAAKTDLLTTWTPATSPQTRTIQEADVRIPSGFPPIEACFQQTLVHELGHVLGLGHSTDPRDLMYPTIDLSNPASCRTTLSAAELTRLQEVYGVNRAPWVEAGATVTVPAQQSVTLRADAGDPDGDLLSYSWRQVSGAAVVLSDAASPSPSFTASSPGDLEFALTVVDRYLHQATGTYRVSVGAGSSVTAAAAVPPSGFGLFVFAGGTNAQLLQASGCPAATAAFWVSDGRGDFVVWIPGTSISAVNKAWLDMFPQALPANTPVLGRCRA